MERPSNMSHILEFSKSTMPVMNLRGRRNVVSSTPMRRGGAGGRAASLAVAAAATASHAVCQRTRNDRATAAVERSSAAAATPPRSRSVSRLRAGTSAVDSVKVLTQPGASQRNRRLCHACLTVGGSTGGDGSLVHCPVRLMVAFGVSASSPVCRPGDVA